MDKQSVGKEQMNRKKYILIGIFLIMAVGIFLRTYHFSDWLPFNPDQARDTKIASDWVNGKSAMPLLGPKAGGTEFHMGPVFYYFEFASAKLFGDMPDKMAYPDLFFSILSIPLFYFFLKKYFSSEISLVLTFLFSISFFIVQYSRFSWNPNQIPFFTLLFFIAILQLAEERIKYKPWWIILLAASLAILIQLHTLLLISLPVFLLFILVYFIKRKILCFKEIGIILSIIFFLNFGQIYSEIVTKWANSKQFIQSASSRSGNSVKFFSNFKTIALCQLESNLHIIYPTDTREECNIDNFIGDIMRSKHFFHGTRNNMANISIFLLAVIFSIGGYSLLYFFYKKETEINRKNFLKLIALYNFLIILILITVAGEIQIRYFIILFFIPFILLGLWFEGIAGKKHEYLFLVLMLATIISAAFNWILLKSEYRAYASGQKTDRENCIMKDLVPMIGYILSASDKTNAIQLSGKNLYLTRFARPVSYLLEKRGIEVIIIKDDAKINKSLPIFYFTKNGNGESQYKSPVEEYGVKNLEKFNKIMILKLEALTPDNS